MPIYEFKCTKCENVFEKITDMGTENCPCPKCNTVSYKDNGSFMFAAHGLPNGHIGARTAKDVVNKQLDQAVRDLK